MRGVIHNAGGVADEAGGVNVRDRGKRDSSDLLSLSMFSVRPTSPPNFKILVQFGFDSRVGGASSFSIHVLYELVHV